MITLHFLLAVVAAMCGGPFLYGYNMAVVNTPSPLIREFYTIVYATRAGLYPVLAVTNDSVGVGIRVDSTSQDNETMGSTLLNGAAEKQRLKELEKQLGIELLWTMTIAIYLIGGMLGAFASGRMADKLGRKPALLINQAFSILGAFLFGIVKVTKLPELMLVARFLVGVASGVGLGLAPLYLSELATASIRGPATSACHLAVTFGMLTAQLLGLAGLLGTGDGWPYLFAFVGIPSFITLAVLPFCPETPRFMMTARHGGEQHITDAYVWLYGKEGGEAEANALVKEQRRETLLASLSSMSSLHNVSFRRTKSVNMDGTMVNLRTGVEDCKHCQRNLDQLELNAVNYTVPKYSVRHKSSDSEGEGEGDVCPKVQDAELGEDVQFQCSDEENETTELKLNHSLTTNRVPAQDSLWTSSGANRNGEPQEQDEAANSIGTAEQIERANRTSRNASTSGAKRPTSLRRRNSVTQHAVTIARLLCSQEFRLPVFLALWLHVNQQWSGINAVVAYSGSIFARILPPDVVQYAILSIGLASVTSTAVMLPLMSRFGRRTVILVSCAVMAASHILLTVCSMLNGLVSELNYVAVVFMIVYICGYAATGCTPAVLVSEMFLQNSRAVAMSLAIATRWGSAFVLLLCFPYLWDLLGEYTFLVFAAVCLASFVMFFLWLHETQGRTASQIHDELAHGFEKVRFHFHFLFLFHSHSSHVHLSAMEFQSWREKEKTKFDLTITKP